jgi:predicted Zn finger-like uncharacterized protein
MIISCPSCSTNFQFDASLLGTEGRMVRCAKCRHTWIQAPPQPAFEPEPESDFPEPPLFEDEPPPRRRAKKEKKEEEERGGRGIVAISLIIVLVLLVSTAAAAVILRDHVMVQWPATLAMYDIVGLVPSVEDSLKIVDEAFAREEEDGVVVLVISGRIVNESAVPMTVPAMEARLLDSDSDEITAWIFLSEADRLLPGATAPFLTRFRDPPPETRSIKLILTTE